MENHTVVCGACQVASVYMCIDYCVDARECASEISSAYMMEMTIMMTLTNTSYMQIAMGPFCRINHAACKQVEAAIARTSRHV
jgi:hypothetical protein